MTNSSSFEPRMIVISIISVVLAILIFILMKPIGSPPPDVIFPEIRFPETMLGAPLDTIKSACEDANGTFTLRTVGFAVCDTTETGSGYVGDYKIESAFRIKDGVAVTSRYTTDSYAYAKYYEARMWKTAGPPSWETLEDPLTSKTWVLRRDHDGAKINVAVFDLIGLATSILAYYDDENPFEEGE